MKREHWEQLLRHAPAIYTSANGLMEPPDWTGYELTAGDRDTAATWQARGRQNVETPLIYGVPVQDGEREMAKELREAWDDKHGRALRVQRAKMPAKWQAQWIANRGVAVRFEADRVRAMEPPARATSPRHQPAKELAAMWARIRTEAARIRRTQKGGERDDNSRTD